MSLLEELKQQASQKQDTSQQADEERKEQFYQETLKPKMRLLLGYLSELTEQLKVVDPDVFHGYFIPGFGLIQQLRQGGYVVNADSTDQTRLVRLKFQCSSDQEQVFAVRPKSEADETRAFLESQNMRYSEWPIRDAGQGIVGINFQLQIKIDINFIFQADPEQGVIRMITTNFADFGIDRTTLQPHRITDQWLDNLGNYMLRRHQKLYSLEIEEEEKKRIRRQLEEEKQARQIELELALRREQEELEEKRRNSFLGRLKGLAKKA